MINAFPYPHISERGSVIERFWFGEKNDFCWVSETIKIWLTAPWGTNFLRPCFPILLPIPSPLNSSTFYAPPQLWVGLTSSTFTASEPLSSVALFESVRYWLISLFWCPGGQENEERQGASAEQFRCKFPKHTISAQGDAFKSLGTSERAASNSETRDSTCKNGPCLQDCQGPWRPGFFLRKHWSPFTVSPLYLTILSHFSPDTESEWKCHRVEVEQGLKWQRTPSPHVFNKLRDSRPGEQGQPQIQSVFLSIPAN